MRIASVPAGHVYVRHLAHPGSRDGVVRLPDPPVAGVPAGQWWPPPMLDPSWVRAHAAEFDVLHVHFGYDDRSPADLTALAAAVRDTGKALVVTVHDLRNPHHADPAAHDAALGVLVPAADALLTLTPGAAAEIARRWGRAATVVPHPHVVGPDRIAAPRPPHDGFVVGMHAKSVRANADPLPVARALADAVAELPGARLRVDAHDDARGRAVAAALPGVDVRVHPPFSDDDLWDYLTGLDLSVLPYRFGTHSGWLEACHDLGTAVLAPDCGFYAEQAPCLLYGHDERHLDVESLRAAVRRAHDERPAWRADPEERRVQREGIAAVHAAVYRSVAA
ncbi:glycosyltransferase family 1 protein [Pseudonocardia abyssalis]|uniref:Glycosyltransferase family 1 protein n=1 Tax=Pseudonocardia abyssalis TaxID=2792008 RepID=A0ABS6UUT8_9PSEU|nr:glycosyltransferase family 1 protein [Pseudonocardia abyssalis]MBW0118392.1 glycosyltransferase family 1 protein [Pseudonocardia abyssalis]MBW0136039.1 glycosyltransferase family 1 protein [Pseudonocardia abyssalis]